MKKEIEERMRTFKEYEAMKMIESFLNEEKEVLIIGGSWGRDYYNLREGRNITNLDLVKMNLPNFIIHDITKGKFPFKKERFEVIIIAEVLEHIFEDNYVLREIKRILKKNGKLIVSVPYYHDADFHVRIHSPKSIKKLLNSEGFEIVEYLERGCFNNLSFLINRVSKLFNGKTQKKFLDFFVRIDMKLGRNGNKVFKYISIAGLYGGYILLKKGKKKDFVKINKKAYNKEAEIMGFL